METATVSPKYQVVIPARVRRSMDVVDSSGWLEYFADGSNGAFFSPVIEKPSDLVVPTVSLYEVFKQVLHQRDESQALHAAALMQQGLVVDLTARLP